jgi:hypothetical protein
MPLRLDPLWVPAQHNVGAVKPPQLAVLENGRIAENIGFQAVGITGQERSSISRR